MALLLMLGSVVGVGLVLTRGSGPAPRPLPPDPAPRPLSLEQARRDTVAVLNATRARYGLRPVARNSRLDAAAQDHAEATAAGRDHPHDRLDARIRAAGFHPPYSEGCGQGQRSPRELIADLNSEEDAWGRPNGGHTRDVRSPAWTTVGVGWARTDRGYFRDYWVIEYEDGQ